jgi:hypothetical protein
MVRGWFSGRISSGICEALRRTASDRSRSAEKAGSRSTRWTSA